MKIKQLYQPYEIEHRVMDAYVPVAYKHTYFEMIFILSGTGIQIVNHQKLPYSSNKLFLIFPKDTHSFEIEEPTDFYFLRFNESYLKSQPPDWLKKLEYIFHNFDHVPGCILKNTPDKELIRSLAEATLRESSITTPYQNEVLQQLINTIITIAARNISLKDTSPAISSSYPLSVQGYVHQHIYNPEQLKIDTIAAYFKLSPHYTSEYFKKQTGVSLQQYIANYRHKLIEARLLYTNNRLNEIATEFGLADTSHLHKIFHKHQGIGPSEFRKLHRNVIE